LNEEQRMTPETRSSGPVTPARILVIKLRHHGDMLLITPLIHALKQQYPAASVDVLLYEETRDMLAANLISTRFSPLIGAGKTGHRPSAQDGVAADSHAAPAALRYGAQSCRSVAKRDYHQTDRRANRIGFDFPKRRHPAWRFCHTALASTQQHNQLHTVQQNLSILAPLGLD
jgi:heptosyltransferase-3